MEGKEILIPDGLFTQVFKNETFINSFLINDKWQ